MPLLLAPETNLPTVISMNSKYYPDFIMKGYTQVDTGHKTDLEEIEEEMLKEIYHD